MTQPNTHSGGGAYDSNENLKPGGEGKPPRPATEPSGSEKAPKGSPTATDPATGAPKKG